jgi:hypothetical protein
MAARPVASTPLTSPAELEQMIRRAGLSLNAGQLADLALAWRQVNELLGRIPRTWKLADDQAYAFRLPPPMAAQAQAAPAAKPATRKAAAKSAPPAKAPPGKAPLAKAPARKTGGKR